MTVIGWLKPKQDMLTSGVSLVGSTGRFAQNHARNARRVAQSIEQLSTGKRINRPADDPSGFIAAEEIRGELIDLRSQGRADRYRRVTFRREQTALADIQSRLRDVRGHIVSAADGSLGKSEHEAIQLEIDESVAAIDRLTEQIDTAVDLVPLQAGGVASPSNADPGRAADAVDAHTEYVATQQAALGAMGRVDEVFTQLRQDKVVILSEALSQIEDTDFAVATAELATGQVLANASIAALAYATQQVSDQVIQLMETIDETVG